MNKLHEFNIGSFLMATILRHLEADKKALLKHVFFILKLNDYGKTILYPGRISQHYTITFF